MHVLLFKSTYDRPKTALRERDGVAALVYFFEVGNRVIAVVKMSVDKFN